MSFDFSAKKKVNEKVYMSASTGSESEDTNSDDKSQKSGKGEGSSWCRWAPVLVFIILFIIIMIGVFCSGCDYKKHCGDGWSTCGIAGVVLLFFIIWLLLLCFFCKGNDSRAAWFFLLLLIAIIFVWVIACFLGKFTSC